MLKAKIKLLITVIVTAIFAVYGVELGMRVLRGTGRVEYFVAVVVVIVVLLLVVLRFYRDYKMEKRKAS
jgi:Mn2+/Fe2+ NRAMP family transporter